MRKCKRVWRKRWPVHYNVKTPRLKEPERRREINHNSRKVVFKLRRTVRVPLYRHIFWERMGVYWK